MKTRTSNQRRQSGFSTLELMMAIVVLAIAVIGASLVPALSLGRSTDAKTYAANVAREVLDSYRGVWQSHDAFTLGTPLPALPTGLRFGCSIPTPTLEAYGFDSSFELVAVASAPSLRRVVVTVECNKGVKIQLSTYIGDPQPKG